ncbi:MAG: DUF58 domain-containing protein [Flavobacteriales bacterium]|nr:DUF58 domain-containing protein [Flavobacteriales bacterium]
MKWTQRIWLTPLFFSTGATAVFLCAFGFSFPLLFTLGKVITGLLFALALADIFILFNKNVRLTGKRELPRILGLADETEVKIILGFKSIMPLTAQILDEIPFQLQERNFQLEKTLNPGKNILKYQIKPINRGTYKFGVLNVLIEGPLHLVKRRFPLQLQEDISVYPSIKQMHETELLAFSRKASPMGHKRHKRIGQSYEFEQISPFVEGDDYRNINWKATGKTRELMVNQYQDERSQNLYCVISKGRTMKMAFEHITYLDYAINATLAISNVALKKYDNVGLITFSDKIGTAIKAENRSGQIRKILDSLYDEKERSLEPDFELLFKSVNRLAQNRSLILLFANFESKHAADRALPMLKKISRKHVLVMILFQDSELSNLASEAKSNVEDIYRITLAARKVNEREEIINKLRKQGVHTISCKPETLSVEVVNKYLELKSRGII